MASSADRWQDVLSELRRCDYLAEAGRVCSVLDSALAAADAGAADGTPSSVLQQLRQARLLYMTDRHGSWNIVERVLADIDDAQALLMLMAGPLPDLQQPATTAAASESRRLNGKRDSIGVLDEGFPIPLHLVPRKPRSIRRAPAPAAAAAAGAAGIRAAVGFGSSRAVGHHEQLDYETQHLGLSHAYQQSLSDAPHYHWGFGPQHQQGLGRPGLDGGLGVSHMGLGPHRQDHPGAVQQGAWGTAPGYSGHTAVAAEPPPPAAAAAVGGDQRSGLVVALADLLDKATSGDHTAAKTLSDVVAAAAQRPGGQEQLLPLLQEAQQHQQRRQQQQQQQRRQVQQLGISTAATQQTLPTVNFADLQAALQKSNKPLPDSIRALLASVVRSGAAQQEHRGAQQQQPPPPPAAAAAVGGITAMHPNAVADAVAAAAAVLSRSKSGAAAAAGVKRTASVAGLPDAAGPGPPQQRQANAAATAAAASSLLQQLIHHRGLDPAAGGAVVGGQGSAAAVIETLGLPFDQNRAKMIEQLSGMLRQRGVHSESQVSAFIAALPAAMTAAATAAAGRSGGQQLGDVLMSLDESAVVKATEAAVAAALQAPPPSRSGHPLGFGGTSDVTALGPRVTTVTGGTSSPVQQMEAEGGTSDVSFSNLTQAEAVAGVTAMLRQQPSMADLSPSKLDALATALVSAMSAAAANGSLNNEMIQLLLQQAQHAVAQAQQIEQQMAPAAAASPPPPPAAAAAPAGILPLVQSSTPRSVAAASNSNSSSLTPLQNAAIALLTSAGAQVTVQQLAAAAAVPGQQQQQQLVEVTVVLPPAGPQRDMVEQLLPKLGLPNCKVLQPQPAAPAVTSAAGTAAPKPAAVAVKPEPAATAAAEIPLKPEQSTPSAPAAAAPAAPAAAVKDAGSSLLNLIKLHNELVVMQAVSDPGSVRYKSITATLELLESSEAFLQEVQRHEAAALAAAAAAAGGAATVEPAQPARVQFVTRTRPAALDVAAQAGKAAAAAEVRPTADLGAAPATATRAGLAALSAQLNMQLSHLKQLRSQVEVQAKHGADKLAAATAAAAGGVLGPISSSTSKGTGVTPPPSAAVAGLSSLAGPRLPAGTGVGSLQGIALTAAAAAAASQGLVTSLGPPVQGLSVLPATTKGLVTTAPAIAATSMPPAAVPSGLIPKLEPTAAPAASNAVSSALLNANPLNPSIPAAAPAAAVDPSGLQGRSGPAAALTAVPAVAASGLNATTLSGLLQQHLSGGGTSAAVTDLLAAVTGKAGAAALRPPAPLAPIKTGQDQQQQHLQQILQSLTGAAAAAAAPTSSPTEQQSRMQWKGAVLAPSYAPPAAGGSSSSSTPRLLQLFALTADLPAEVASLLPDVLVVTAKQPRSEVIINIQQHEPLIMSPAPTCTTEHLAVLHSLSQTKVALLVELPRHDLVLCPEAAAAAALTGGGAVVIGVLRPRRQQQRHTPPPAASLAAALATAAGLAAVDGVNAEAAGSSPDPTGGRRPADAAADVVEPGAEADSADIVTKSARSPAVADASSVGAPDVKADSAAPDNPMVMGNHSEALEQQQEVTGGDQSIVKPAEQPPTKGAAGETEPEPKAAPPTACHQALDVHLATPPPAAEAAPADSGPDGFNGRQQHRASSCNGTGAPTDTGQ